MKTVNFGIDLGTTNSLIAKYENGQAKLFRNPVGHRECLPSVVAFRKERTLVGDKAREYLLKDSINVFGGFKRRMGSDDRLYVVNIDENVTPVELSAFVLKELKQFVHTSETVDAAVITVPASFDTMQANATIQAGKLAGFQEVFLLQEPVAAALAYCNNKMERLSGYRLVFDLGGGTFDIALVEVKDGEMKVKDHEGNNFLGGTDFDTLIVDNLFVPRITAETGVTDMAEQLTMKGGKYEKLYYRLKYYAEEIKKELTVQKVAEVDFSAEMDGRTYDFLFTVGVEQFNELIAPVVRETVRMIHTVLDRNLLKALDVNEIILVGGSTLIPYVRTCLQETGIRINTDVDPITAIATGAAYYSANKYYTPKKRMSENEPTTKAPTSEKHSVTQENKEMPLQLVLSYSKMSREDEEVLLVRADGFYTNHTCRITRSDGGFDTGLMPLKDRFTVFLPLLPKLMNTFHLRIFDGTGSEKKALAQTVDISQGQYHTSGQLLPKDICIELDDREANCTRLELVFERNSILPLKKTLYREISKTIRKDSSESLIIHLLEGDRFARPASNIQIGFIEISGRQLTSDLIKGSDIEIQITISDNRELTVETCLMMTQQEFTNTFTVSEKHVNVALLKEQYASLETEVRNTLKQFNAEDSEIWAIQTENLMRELERHGKDLAKLNDDDATDKRYIIDEAVTRISQELDRIGGNERLETLQSRLFRIREMVEQTLPSVDEAKEMLNARYRKIAETENMVLKSRNPAVIRHHIDRLEALYYDMLWNINSHVEYRFSLIRNYPKKMFSNYHAAQQIFSKAEHAINDNRYLDLRRMLHDLYNLLQSEPTVKSASEQPFKGMGIS